MPSYLVESYASPDLVEAQWQSARRAAELAASVEHVRTTVLPEDEVVLHIFEATSEATLREAVARAGLEHERIVKAVEHPATAVGGNG